MNGKKSDKLLSELERKLQEAAHECALNDWNDLLKYNQIIGFSTEHRDLCAWIFGGNTDILTNENFTAERCNTWKKALDIFARLDNGDLPSPKLFVTVWNTAAAKYGRNNAVIDLNKVAPPPLYTPAQEWGLRLNLTADEKRRAEPYFAPM
jgi:hypothetical protein